MWSIVGLGYVGQDRIGFILKLLAVTNLPEL